MAALWSHVVLVMLESWGSVICQVSVTLSLVLLLTEPQRVRAGGPRGH